MLFRTQSAAVYGIDADLVGFVQGRKSVFGFTVFSITHV